MSAGKSIGLAIPAYRSVANLRRCLASVQSYAPDLLRNTVVVDDGGAGMVASALESEFPQVRWVVNEHNSGFGEAANRAVRETGADVTILLNDDVELLSDPRPALQHAFNQDDVFAVSFRSLQPDGTQREGAKRLVWRMGMPRVLHNERDQKPAIDGRYPSDYAVGGHAAYDRTRFEALNGFDALFAPFYWEDVDLCARAAQRGWQTFYVPECIVTHHHEGAIRQAHDRQRIRTIVQRNRLLFAFRHCPKAMRPLLKLSTGYHSLESLWSGDSIFVEALKQAEQTWDSRES